MPKPVLFLSHTSGDRDLAHALQEMVSEALLGAYEIFNSSDETSIAPGDAWRETIVNKLQQSQTVLVLATPESITRPWVNFETGAGWAVGARVVPCCASGLSKAELSTPLNHLQAIDLTDEADLRRLLSQLASQAGLDAPKGYDFAGAAVRLSALSEDQPSTPTPTSSPLSLPLVLPQWAYIGLQADVSFGRLNLLLAGESTAPSGSTADKLALFENIVKEFQVPRTEMESSFYVSGFRIHSPKLPRDADFVAQFEREKLFSLLYLSRRSPETPVNLGWMMLNLNDLLTFALSESTAKLINNEARCVAFVSLSNWPSEGVTPTGLFESRQLSTYTKQGYKLQREYNVERQTACWPIVQEFAAAVLEDAGFVAFEGELAKVDRVQCEDLA